MNPIDPGIPTGPATAVDLTAFVLNINSFGAGLGLVLAGWVAGMVVGYVFSIIRSLGHLR